jgi:hypothetical protein
MSAAVTLRGRTGTDILRPVSTDRLTHLLNELARRRLDPVETDELRAAVYDAIGPADAGVRHETWVSLLDHFAVVDPDADAITDGAGYVREVARAIRAEAGPAAPAPPDPPSAYQVVPGPAPVPAPGRKPRWPPVLAAVLVLLLAGGAIGAVTLLRSRGTHPSQALPSDPATTVAPTPPASSPSPGPTSSPTEVAPSPSPTPSSRRSPPQPSARKTTSPPPPAPTVVFTGTAADPTITVKGSGFGTERPGKPWIDTPCGSYTDNGKDYGADLWFVDTGHFSAGNGGCVGIKVTTWSPNRVVFKFGNAYNTFDHWYVTAGDEYTVFLLGREFTGTITFG